MQHTHHAPPLTTSHHLGPPRTTFLHDRTPRAGRRTLQAEQLWVDAGRLAWRRPVGMDRRNHRHLPCRLPYGQRLPFCRDALLEQGRGCVGRAILQPSIHRTDAVGKGHLSTLRRDQFCLDTKRAASDLDGWGFRYGFVAYTRVYKG